MGRCGATRRAGNLRKDPSSGTFIVEAARKVALDEFGTGNPIYVREGKRREYSDRMLSSDTEHAQN
jgi:hypothetical protein